MKFEYDTKKSLSNKQKYGIDFEEAKLLQNNKNSLIIPTNMVDKKMRHAMISTLDKNYENNNN